MIPKKWELASPVLVKKGRECMKKSYRIIVTALLTLTIVGLCALVGCNGNQADDTTNMPQEPAEPEKQEVVLQIYAANSLTKALAEVQELYTEDHDWVSFADTQFEASGTLVESLKAGSYADLLITASKGTMDTAEEASLVDPTSRFDMFSNELVIVSKTGSGLSDITLEDVASGQYALSIGDENVPAGNYACQALSTVGAYTDPSGQTGANITGKGGAFAGINPVLDSSVGNVCKRAESGEVDLAIVYTSDVYRFGGVEIVGTIADDTHKSIIYPAAICTDSKYTEEVEDFLKWATTDSKALKIWQEWGFELVA